MTAMSSDNLKPIDEIVNEPLEKPVIDNEADKMNTDSPSDSDSKITAAEADEEEENEPPVVEEPEEKSENVDSSKDDGLDKTEDEPTPDEKQEDDSDNFKESPYVKNQFLRFGFQEDLPFIDTQSAFEYLTECGFGNNSLTQARERAYESAIIEGVYDPHKDGCRYCDFCGAELTGVEYEIINDGRERCNECSRTVIKTLDEFNEVFTEVRKNMESMFGIRILASVDVKTMDARKLAKKLKMKFTPTAGFDGRVLGVAINENGIYHLYVENQSPYLNAVATIAHELTHIWQYVNWDAKKILKKYGKKMNLCIYEGMAKWVEIQYLYFINEPERAYRELCATLNRNDEYGIGLSLYLDEYRLSKGVIADGVTPFFDKITPLHQI